MIKITKATRRQIKYFNEKEWHGVDIEHYGKPVQWIDQSFIFKATENGEIIGTSSGKFESGVVYVDTLMVGARMRGKGIGQKLIKKVEDYGRKKGAHKVHLITGKDWKAEEFYKKVGYKKIAVLPNHHFHRDFVIYEKGLSS